MTDCIFCKIIEGSIPSTKVYEDEKILAFRDINPVAKTHVIIIPKYSGTEHVSSADGLNAGNTAVIAHIFARIPEIAKSLGLSGGYRIVSNCGKDAGQSVAHLHFHLIGGESLPWGN